MANGSPPHCDSVDKFEGLDWTDVAPAVLMMRHTCQQPRIFTVNQGGVGNVVRIENDDPRLDTAAFFTVQPVVPGTVVHPILRGGINDDHKRLYVPACYTTLAETTYGEYVRLVDINPSSTSYLQTVDTLACGVGPMQIAFTRNEAYGVVAHLRDKKATVFQAPNTFKQNVDCFDGGPSTGNFSGAVTVAKFGDNEERACVALREDTGSAGVAILSDLPGTPTRSNVDVIGDHVGIAAVHDPADIGNPDTHILLLDAGTTDDKPKLHVLEVKNNTLDPLYSIELPNDAGEVYEGSIATNVGAPYNNFAVMANGTDTLTVAQFVDKWTLRIGPFQSPTREVEVLPLDYPPKPHLVVGSLVGTVAILPL